MRRLLVFPLAFLFLLAACEDSARSPTGAPDGLDAPLFSLQSDGATGGNPHFFFLPPLVSNPSATGTPDMGWSPKVVICVAPANDDECPTGSGEFATSTQGQHYKLDWAPGEDSDAKVDETWRIEVHVAGFRLGFLDVSFVENARDARDFEGEGVVLVGTDRNVPVRFRIEEDAVAEAVLASECELDDVILACDVQEGDPDTETQARVFDPEAEEDDHLAGLLNVPQQGSGFGKYIVIIKNLQNLTPPVLGLPNPPRPYFLSVQILDEDGNPVTLVDPALLTLCLKFPPATGEFPFLRIFRVIPGEGGETEILETGHDDTECGEAPNNSASLFKGRLSPLNRVAGFFRAQPLGALHGGLHTTRDIFSEFGAVLAEEPEIEADRWVNVNATAVDAPGTSCEEPGYTSIQAAITASSAGEVIVVCPGDYASQGNINVTRQNLVVIASWLHVLSPEDRPEVSEFSFSGSGNGSTVAGFQVGPAGITGNSSSSGLVITQNRVTRDEASFGSSRGIFLYGSDSEVSNNQVSGFLNGILLGRPANHATGMTVDGNTVTGNASGINFANASGSSASRNSAVNNGTGLRINQVSSNVTVVDENFLCFNTTRDVLVDGDNNTISGNVLDQIEDNGDDNTIEDNQACPSID